MWELIRANKRRSFVLFIMMGSVLIGLGFLLGIALGGPAAGTGGIVIAVVLWLILVLIAMVGGSKILLASSKAKEVKRDVHPQLFNIVEEMQIAAGLKAMPKVYIIQTDALNAFAAGMKPENSAIAVTAGLLATMNRDELQGVVAHEMSHIINRDIRFMTLAGVMLGSVVLVSEIFLRGMIYGSATRYRSSSGKGGGQAQLVMLVVAVVAAILAPIAAQLLYFSISRKREYLADASAARLTRYPEGLASALEKISLSTADIPAPSKVTAPLYIANPLKKKGKRINNLTSTHPPVDERIRILRSMNGAAYLNYQSAYQALKGANHKLLPNSALTDNEGIPIRGASLSEDVISKTPVAKSNASVGLKNIRRETGDIIMAAN
ncbi:MAG: M48 family metallopeptidase, partial [Bacteroidales bacterium]|nr:M48 family metallopeptidase [Bacteroidales bacterium]